MDRKLYALNPDGSTKWTYTAVPSIRSSPAIGPEGNIYFGTDGGLVYAVNSSGTLVWTRGAGFYIDSSPAVDAFGNVIVGSWDGYVYALRATNGFDVWAPFLTGAAIQSPPVIHTNGVVYIGNDAGRLYALQNVAGPARSDWPMFRQNPRHTANPATLRLGSGVRLGDLDFQFQVSGLIGMTCVLEASDNSENWNTLGSVTLTTQSAAFTDVQASGYPYRFYRARSGAILSYNSLGYMAVSVPTGYSMVANQLDNPGGNTVGVLLVNPPPPTGTTLNKWNEGNQGYDINTYSGSWSLPNMTLNPGEGVIVQPGTATTFTFIGDVRQGALAISFPAGQSIRSSMVPQTGPIDTSLGFPLLNGISINRMINPAGGYETYTFVDGAWEPAVPVPRVGESFWINTSAAGTWTRNFSIW